MTGGHAARPAGQALVSNQAPACFDPSRVAEIIQQLSPARKRSLAALNSDSWETVSEMAHRGATGAGMDVLYTMHHPRLCERRWTKWGGEVGQKRGEGYEYRLTPLGEAIRDVIAMEARSGETEGLDPEGTTARAEGIAEPCSPTPITGDHRTMTEVERVTPAEFLALRAERDGALITASMYRSGKMREQGCGKLGLLEEYAAMTAPVGDVVERLLGIVAPMFPITTGQSCPDYADVHFGAGHSSQVMTTNPEHWDALNDLFTALTDHTTKGAE